MKRPRIAAGAFLLHKPRPAPSGRAGLPRPTSQGPRSQPNPAFPSRPHRGAHRLMQNPSPSPGPPIYPRHHPQRAPSRNPGANPGLRRHCRSGLGRLAAPRKQSRSAPHRHPPAGGRPADPHPPRPYPRQPGRSGHPEAQPAGAYRQPRRHLHRPTPDSFPLTLDLPAPIAPNDPDRFIFTTAAPTLDIIIKGLGPTAAVAIKTPSLTITLAPRCARKADRHLRHSRSDAPPRHRFQGT